MTVMRLLCVSMRSPSPMQRVLRFHREPHEDNERQIDRTSWRFNAAENGHPRWTVAADVAGTRSQITANKSPAVSSARSRYRTSRTGNPARRTRRLRRHCQRRRTHWQATGPPHHHRCRGATPHNKATVIAIFAASDGAVGARQSLNELARDCDCLCDSILTTLWRDHQSPSVYRTVYTTSFASYVWGKRSCFFRSLHSAKIGYTVHVWQR